MSEHFINCVRGYIKDHEYFNFANGLLNDNLPQEIDYSVLDMLKSVSESLSDDFPCQAERAHYFLFVLQTSIKEMQSRAIDKKTAEKANKNFIKKGEEFLEALQQLTPKEKNNINFFSTVTDEIGREITPAWVICRMLSVAKQNVFTRADVTFRQNESISIFALPLKNQLRISNTHVRTLLNACEVYCTQKQIDKALERGDTTRHQKS